MILVILQKKLIHLINLYYKFTKVKINIYLLKIKFFIFLILNKLKVHNKVELKV